MNKYLAETGKQRWRMRTAEDKRKPQDHINAHEHPTHKPTLIHTAIVTPFVIAHTICARSLFLASRSSSLIYIAISCPRSPGLGSAFSACRGILSSGRGRAPEVQVGQGGQQAVPCASSHDGHRWWPRWNSGKVFQGLMRDMRMRKSR